MAFVPNGRTVSSRYIIRHVMTIVTGNNKNVTYTPQ